MENDGCLSLRAGSGVVHAARLASLGSGSGGDNGPLGIQTAFSIRRVNHQRCYIAYQSLGGLNALSAFWGQNMGDMAQHKTVLPNGEWPSRDRWWLTWPICGHSKSLTWWGRCWLVLAVTWSIALAGLLLVFGTSFWCLADELEVPTFSTRLKAE